MTPAILVPRSPVVVTIGHSDSDSPSNEDGWTLYSANLRHTNYRDPREFTDDHGYLNIGLRRQLKVGTAFILGYFEHGAYADWHLNAERPMGTEGDYKWDGTSGAGILIWEQDVNDMGAKSREDRAKDARGFLDTYNDWCNGQVFWFAVKRVGDCGECGKERDLEDLEGFGDFYGSYIESMFEEIRGATEGHEVIRIDGEAGDGVSLSDVQGEAA